MSFCRSFMTKTGIHFPHGVGFVRIAKQAIVNQPKRFFEVPYDEQYESRDFIRIKNQPQNEAENAEEIKSAKIHTDKKISNESDNQ